MKRKSVLSVWALGVGCFLLLISGCGQRYTAPGSFLDTPHHHVASGFRLLESNRIEDAKREFDRAIQLNRSYAPAYCGLALVAGEEGDFPRAFESMNLAEGLAKTDGDRAAIQVGYMRLYTTQKGKRWMENVQASYRNAVSSKKDLPEAYFRLGIAYKEAYRFRKSEKMFQKVLESRSHLVLNANRELEIVRTIVRASPGSTVGKQIAMKDRITRADVAALVIEELKLDRMDENATARKPRVWNSRLEGTGKSRRTVPPDAKSHPLESDIEAALRLNITGLRTYPDGTFRPDQPISRAEYAEIMGEIIVSLRNDPALMTCYSGKPGPFSDMTNNDPYFNAVMLCTTGMGIMGPVHGIFNPAGGISGAEALLIIRKLKDRLKIN